MFEGCSELTYLDASNFDTSHITDMSGMFKDCTNLKSINLNNFNTELVTTMESTFSGCESLESLDLSNFNNYQLTTMLNMFYGCIELISINLNNFVTSSVTNMNSVFLDCSKLNELDLSSFNTNKVTEMEYMFQGCNALTSINLNNFDTSSVTDMTKMFYDCKNLVSLDLSNFNTINVENMINMFGECSKLTILNLKNFNTNKVSSFSGIFQGCGNLKALNISSFIYQRGISTYDMFSDCNESMIYCINEENTPDDVKEQLSDFPNLYCSDTCFQNEVNKIIPCTNSCIVSCENDNIYKYEYNGACYLYENHNDSCKDISTILSTIMEYTYDLVNTLDKTEITEINYFNDIIKSSEVKSEDSTINIDLPIYIKVKEENLTMNIDYIYNLINTTDKTKAYIMENDYSMIIIKPLGVRIEHSTVNIDFSECQKKLEGAYPEKTFRILQINLANEKEDILVDQVEYQVFDENNEAMDLSICDNIEIPIEYKIKNSSLLKLNEASHFKDMGVDVFNLNDQFFNDICYPYSDNDSSSDMILSDRVKDIYQNVSLCGSDCEYQSFNFETNSSKCLCKLKKEINTEPDKGNFKTYIVSAFLESNFGVIKCYSLVFSLKNKLSNIGFWIFGIMMLSHIPLYIFYFKNGAKSMIRFISKEMKDKGYIIPKKKEEKIKREKGKDNLVENIDNKDNLNNNHKLITKNFHDNPPKKRKSTKRISERIKLAKNIKESENDNINSVTKRYTTKRKTINYIKKNTYVLGSNDKLNINNINDKNQITIEDVGESRKIKKIKSNNKQKGKGIKLKKLNTYALILRNANNEINPVPYQSDYIINNFVYDEAIIYEDRSYCRIFFIILIGKENLLNMIILIHH